MIARFRLILAATLGIIHGVQLTRYGHSCVRLAAGGSVLVVDPGEWSDPAALREADAVLLTHEHPDHADLRRLRRSRLPVYAPEGAFLPGLNAVRVNAGDRFTAAGLNIVATGGDHAPVRDGRPDCANLGYLIDDAVYHPGDSLSPPPPGMGALLVPVHAPWLKTAEAIEFVLAARPRRAFGIHDAQLNDLGLASANGWLAQQTDDVYAWLPPGEQVTVA